MNLGLNLALGSRAASGGFNPAAALFGAGEQGYWLDPSDFSTMFQDAAGTTPVTAVGQSVRRILDKSGRGNHFTQANTANAPVLQVDANGLHFLLFDGTDDWLQSAATINPGAVDKAQVFAGVRRLTDGAYAVIVEVSASYDSNNGLFTMGNTNAWLVGSKGTFSALMTAASAAPITSVLTGLGDISGDRTILRVDGTRQVSSPADQGTGNYLPYTHYIGRRGGTTAPFNGRLYQLITRYGANLSADRIAQTETFVNQRTGAF